MTTGFPSTDIGQSRHFHGNEGELGFQELDDSFAVNSEHDNNREVVYRTEAQGSVGSSLYSTNVFPIGAGGNDPTIVFSSNPRRRGAVLVNSGLLTVQLVTNRGLLPTGAGFQLVAGASITIDTTDTVYASLLPGAAGSSTLSVYVSENLDQ